MLSLSLLLLPLLLARLNYEQSNDAEPHICGHVMSGFCFGGCMAETSQVAEENEA